MKKIFWYILFALSCFCGRGYAMPNDTVFVASQYQQIQQKTNEIIEEAEVDVVSSLTLAVNAINNIMTWSAIFIAFLTLIVAIIGFVGYNRMYEVVQDNIKKNDEKVDAKIRAIDAKQEMFNDCVSRTQVISEQLKGQEKYICKTSDYLFAALDKITNQIPDADTGKAIMKQMWHNYQITSLYSADEGKEFAALAFLQENGTIDDIEHLEFVSTYDRNDHNKTWAREILGLLSIRT
jgi:hypothetical protein